MVRHPVVGAALVRHLPLVALPVQSAQPRAAHPRPRRECAALRVIHHGVAQLSCDYGIKLGCFFVYHIALLSLLQEAVVAVRATGDQLAARILDGKSQDSALAAIAGKVNAPAAAVADAVMRREHRPFAFIAVLLLRFCGLDGIPHQ